MLTEFLLDVVNVGAEWVLWVLVALSLASIAVIGERINFFMGSRAETSSLRRELLKFLDKNQVTKAKKFFQQQGTMEGQVLAAGLDGAPQGPESVGELMNGMLATEKLRYERGLSFLATVGSNTPYIGLFGTVLGIINAFAALSLGSGGEIGTDVMGPISEALVATGVGLFVAIPAVVAFNTFKTRVKKSVANTDKLARTLLAYLSADPSRGLTDGPSTDANADDATEEA